MGRLFTYYIKVAGERRIEFILAQNKELADEAFKLRFAHVVDLELEESYPSK